MVDPLVAASVGGAIGIVGAVVGGIAGAYSSFHLRKPKPRVGVLKLTMEALPCIDVALLEPQLRQHYFDTPEPVRNITEKNPYLEQFSPFYDHVQAYVCELNNANFENSHYKKLYEKMPDVIRAMRSDLKSESIGRFLRNWQKHSLPLWFKIAEAYLHNKISDKMFESAKKNDRPLHQIEQISRGEFAIYIGSHEEDRIDIRSSSFTNNNTALSNLASNVANAIAYEDIVILEKIMNEIFDGVEWHDLILEETEKIINEELRRLAKIMVRGVITNSGRSTFPVSGNATFNLRSKGFRYEDEKTGKMETLDRDIVIDMICVDDETYVKTIPSIAVSAGSAELFVAVSQQYIYQMTDSVLLRSLFGTERKCQIVFERFDEPQAVHSDEFLFSSLTWTERPQRKWFSRQDDESKR